MSCPIIPELRKVEFGKRLREKAAANRIPLGGTFELTFRCNLRCIHCYCNLPANEHRASEQELTSGEIKSLVDTLVEEGSLWFLLTGGEPLLRPDFPEIYRYIREKGMVVTLFTNGTLITSEIADLLYEYPPFQVEITLYGATQPTYEKVTQVVGSYKRCIKGIALLLDRGLRVNLKTMAMTVNRHELDEMQAFADRLGLKFRFDPLLNGRVDNQASENPFPYRLTPEDVVQLDLNNPKRLDSLKEFTQSFSGPVQTDRLFFCGAGLMTYHIDPYGVLYVCMLDRTDGYNLRRGSFQEGWYHYLGQVRLKKPEHAFQCRDCNLVALCGNCPGWSYLEHRNESCTVDYLCQVAHLRAKAIGVK